MKETIDLDTSECFFHYTTREAAFKFIVPDNRLRFSPYEKMRDPLESRPPFFTGSWFVQPDEPADLRMKQAQAFYSGSHGVFQLAHLLAFTIDADDYEPHAEKFARGWSRPRMWEHYAENHEGVCLVFDKEKLTANIRADILDQLNVKPYHRRVDYSETGRENYIHLQLGELPDDVDDEYVRKYIEEHNDELFFKKVLDWRTEYEYRFVTTASPDEPLYVDFGDALVGIVAGWKLPRWERPAVIEAAHEIEINPVIMNWKMGTPVPVPLVRESREEEEQFEANFRTPPPEDPPHLPSA